ncbi:MAG: carbohydrate kinase family protein [Candidatus Saccharibacteria bacterium]|nr:carbohydrate kinase family protein [Candidatus Saccharibacteria bacterium]
MSQFDIISVGDIVTDAFIKLLDDQAASYKNEHGKWLAMPFGSKLPFDHADIIQAVGNAPNASVGFSRLGLKSGLVSNVGGDQAGRDMIAKLTSEKVDHRFVRVNPDMDSNYHYILWYKEERTILIKHEEYDYHWPQFKSDETPEWIYFSSISRNALVMHDTIAEWLEQNPDVKMAFQPGTFQIEMGAGRLANLYAKTAVLLLNREEAVIVSGGNYDDIHDLFDRLHQLGPQVVVITDGPDGAYASDGEERYKMPAYPDPAPPLERTGAGDAFSSAFVAALVKGNNIEGALQWAPINSMNVVQHVGAQEGLLSEDKVEELLQRAPDWYKPQKM